MSMQAMMSVHFDGIRGQRPEFETAVATWTDKLSPELTRLEDERKALLKKAYTRTALVAVAVILVLAIIGITARGAGIFPFGILLGIAAGFAGSAAVWMPVMSMKSQTKQLIVSAACEPFGFTYDTLHPDMSGVSDFRSLGNWIKQNSSGGIGGIRSFSFSGGKVSDAPTAAFPRLNAAGLLPSYDSSKFEDMITGNRAGANFDLVECKLTEQQGSGKNRRTVTKFQGLLIHIEYPDRFLGRTLIARQGWWKRGRDAKGLQKVQLVSKELEDAFTVYSTDQVEARTLLTPDRMERLIALERHFKGGKLRGVFEDGHMTIALEAKDQFEAGSIFKPLIDPERYIETLTEIGLVCDLIDGFLTRDWVKGRL